MVKKTARKIELPRGLQKKVDSAKRAKKPKTPKLTGTGYAYTSDDLEVPIGEWDTIMLGKEKTAGAKFVERRAANGEMFEVFQLKNKSYVARTVLE